MHNRDFRGYDNSQFQAHSGVHPMNTLHVPSNGLYRGGICL